MDRGASTITHNRRNGDTPLRSCIYTHLHPCTSAVKSDKQTELQDHLFSKRCQSLSAILNFYHPNYPPFKIPPLSSHTFHPFPLPPRHCSSISVQPSYYLIMLKVSQKPGFSPKSWTGGTTWQTRTAVCLAVFFQAFVHRMIKKEPGVQSLLCSRGHICEGLLEYSQMSFTDYSRNDPCRHQDGKGR